VGGKSSVKVYFIIHQFQLSKNGKGGATRFNFVFEIGKESYAEKESLAGECLRQRTGM